MTTDSFEPEPLKKPDDIDDGFQLPEGQRHYIHANEEAEYTKLNMLVYTGKRGGRYVDAKGNKSNIDRVVADKWVKNFITNDPDTGKARTVAPPFEITVEDENSGDMVKLSIEGLYHVPNHGPNGIEYEDDSIRPAGQTYTDENGKKIESKKDINNKPVIATANHALVLNGDAKIPATAQKGSVYLSNEPDSPIQALYRTEKGKQTIIFTPKEKKRRKDTFWSYQRAAFDDIDVILPSLDDDIENVNNWNDSQKVIALVGLTGFRHGNTGKPRRLPKNKEELENQKRAHPEDAKKRVYTGERTGIGAGALIASEVHRSKDSVTFKFTGKEDVPQEHEYNDSTEEGRRILAIVDSALKGKGPEDRLFATTTTANNKVLNSLVPDPNREISISTEDRTYTETPHKLEMKNLRTHVGTTLAKKELAKRIGAYRQSISGKSDKAIALAFKTLRTDIGLVVGKALGHKKRVALTPAEKEQVEQGLDVERTWEVKGDMALQNYIDPEIWKDVIPEGTVAKLMKMVKDLQTLSKALPPNAVYSSTEAPPKGAMTFVTEDREAAYWLQSTEVFPQTPDVGDAIEANPQAQQILQDLGQEGTPYVVGGGVRDILIGKPSKDIDIEVHGVPMDKLGQLMEKHGGKPEQVGKQFGVFKVGDVDVSLPRTETKTGTKHTDFDVQAHTSLPLKQAARRRDFTMNALMYDVKNHRILDFFGGHDDIVAKKIKHVDDKTFVEDPLRVYRAAQFAGRFGFSIDASTIKLARSMDLSDLPKERVFEEMSKLLLRSPKPSVGLQALDDMGVLKQQMPELKNLQDTHQRGDYHAEGDVFTHTKMVIDEAAQISKRFEREKDRQIIMLAALSHDLGKPATTDEQGSALGHSEAGIEPTRQLLSKLTTDTEIIETVLALVEHHLVPLNYHNNRNNVKDSTFRRLINKHGTRFLQLLSAVSEADNAGRLHKQPDGNTIKPTHEANEWFRANINRIAAKEGITEKGKLQPLVTGKDLLDLGFVQGKRVGEVLQDIQRQQEDGKLTDKKEAIEYLQNIHKSYISEYFLKAKGKYKGRTGGITPDWTMKLPGEERDIDEWAEARRKKAEERQWGIKPVGGQPIAKTWVGSLADKGFTYPLIKQVIGSQMWFAQDGIDYIANLGTNEDDLVTSVEKANFVYNRPSISYAPSGRNNQKTKRKSSGMQGERYQGDTIDDEEDDYND